MRFLLATIAWWITLAHWIHIADGFSNSHHNILGSNCHRYKHDHGLAMVVTPIGPCCPFRSTVAKELEADLYQIQTQTTTNPGFAQEFQRTQFEIQQLGRTPDPDTLRQLAEGMDATIDRWEALFEIVKSSKDFGTREYAAVAQAHLANFGTCSKTIALLVRWQSSCLRALADRQPPPMPPPGLDLQQLMDEANRDAFASSSSASSDKKPSISAMQTAQRIQAFPLDSDILESESSIHTEYQKLAEDHSNLIQEGSTYMDWDPSDQISFLDRVESMEHKWEEFFSRFEVNESHLNQDYVDQCRNYLACMKLTEDKYRRVVKESHDRMRHEAQRERDRDRD